MGVLRRIFEYVASLFGVEPASGMHEGQQSAARKGPKHLASPSSSKKQQSPSSTEWVMSIHPSVPEEASRSEVRVDGDDKHFTFDGAKLKGRIGEDAVKNWLSRHINYVGLYNNLIVPEYNGSTHEIDITIVGPTGIYLFEVKNYSGHIYGSEQNEQWKQYLGDKEYEFYNPVKQDMGHRKALAAYLGLDDSSLYSCIVFVGSAKLADVVVSASHLRCICTKETLYATLEQVLDTRPVIFSDKDLAGILKALSDLEATSSIERDTHIENVRRFKEGNTCPLCGRPLKEKEGRYGTFIGCTGYPQCRYTRGLGQ